MKHIIHISSVHRADDTRVYVKECLTLREAGYKVTLVARHPEAGQISDIDFIPLGLGQGGRLRRMTSTVLRVGRIAVSLKGDAYHFHDPELIPVGLILKLLGRKVVYDVHESVPKQIVGKYWIPTILRRPLAAFVDRLERISARFFDRIVVATPGIADRFTDTQTVLVQNFALLKEFLAIHNQDYDQRAPVCVYIGSITEARGVRAMVTAIDRVDAELLLGGPFAPASLEDEVSRMPGWDKVTYLGLLSREEVRHTLARSRIGLVVLEPVPNYLDSYPVKLFEYMAAGIPVIASDFPFWRQFVQDTGAGLMVDPMNPTEIARAINSLLSCPDIAKAMGERGRQAVIDRYSWEQEGAKLVDMYQRLLEDN